MYKRQKYNLGDILKLEVTGTKKGQVYVKELEHRRSAISKDNTSDPALILKNLKMPVNSGRLDIVKAMLDMDFEPESSVIAVSYTHLDVYKRQIP